MLGAVGEQLFEVFLKVGFVVQGTVAALLTLRRSEQNVLMRIVPADFIALVLHVQDKAFFVVGVFQSLVDGFYEPEFPALAPHGGAVFARRQSLLFLLSIVRFEDGEAVCLADFIVDLPLLLQGSWGHMELLAVLEADRVYDDMRVEVVGIVMGSDDTLVVGKQFFGKLTGYFIRLPRRDILFI